MISHRKKKLHHTIIQNFSPETQEKIIFHLNNPLKLYMILIALGFCCFFHSLFSYYTLFSFSLAIASIFLLIKNCITQIHEKGLINFLPKRLQNFMLNRSIFDVLCDLWFIPKMGLYLKAFFGPFYYEYTPDKALNNFETIGLTRAVTVKGFLHLFPGLKKVLLPANRAKLAITTSSNKAKELNGFESDTSNSSSGVASFLEEEKKEENKAEDINSPMNKNNEFENVQINSSYNINQPAFIKIKSTVIFQSETFKAQNIPLTLKDDPRKQAESKATKNKKNKRSPLLNGIIVNKQNKDFYYDDIFDKDGNEKNHDSNLLEENNHKGTRLLKKNKMQSIPLINHEMPIDIPKTKIISSCKKNEKEALENSKKAVLDDDVKISNAWDNRKKFELKKLEEKKKIDDGEIEEDQQVRGMFNLVNLLNEIKKNGILSKINTKVLMKLLAVSSLGLLLQLKYNKKARTWIVNGFMYLGFSAIFLLFGSSLALVVVKSLKSKKTARKSKND